MRRRIDCNHGWEFTPRWSRAFARFEAVEDLYRVDLPHTWKQALERSRTLDRILVPYENAEGIAHTREVIGAIRPGESIGIFIGPEGGFEESEVRQLEEMGGSVITLGHRILRTDTASIATLAMLMLHLES